MLEILLNQYFADTGAAHHHMLKYGFESTIIIANCEPLQKKWAVENNLSFDSKNWKNEIALAQIKKFSPDVFYIESIFEFYGEFLKAAKQHCKKIISWISTPFNEQLNLKNIDLIISSTPAFVKQFKQNGINSVYMLPAFDARVLSELPQNIAKDIPFSFVGGWSHVHIQRKEAIKKLVEKTDIQLWGYGYKKEYSKKSFQFYKNLFFKKDKEILERYKGEVWGLKMYDVLSRSNITFNIHESLLKGRVGNMRMFEASGVGTLILNDYGSNLNDLFEIGKEIESYKSINEAIEKVNFYTKYPQLGQEIAKNAQKRTLKDYTYDNWAPKLIDIIKYQFEW